MVLLRVKGAKEKKKEEEDEQEEVVEPEPEPEPEEEEEPEKEPAPAISFDTGLATNQKSSWYMMQVRTRVLLGRRMKARWQLTA